MSSAQSKRLPREAQTRFARQIALPEIGEAGQARLLASAVACGASEVEAVAALYLERAGVGVAHDGTPLSELPRENDDFLRSLPSDARLAHAHAWLRGSLRAVETIKRVLNEKEESPC
jgi:hypothetical protein